MKSTGTTYPTPFPELNAVLFELVTSVQTILGDNFQAAWLHGSFAVGDFDRHSDVDFIIVVKNCQTVSRRIADHACPDLSSGLCLGAMPGGIVFPEGYPAKLFSAWSETLVSR
jgi:hypothetical protein